MRKLLSVLAAVTLATLFTHAAGADAPPLKIGFLGTFSGPFTASGKTADAAIAAFFKEHGDTVAGRKVVIVKRDDGGNAPDTAKRLAQELIISDQVDFLMGLVFSPNAMAVGDVSTSAKKPTFITNAASYGILEQHPYVARFSYTEGQMTSPLAQWALKNNLKTAYTIVLDYAPGIDAATGFQSAFTAGGGKIVGEARVPPSAQDYSAYVQRIKDAHPQVIFAFLTVSGGPFLKAWYAAGGPATGTKILATVDLTNESTLPGLGDDALGVITAGNYAATHNSALNRELTRDMHAADPAVDGPEFASVATYDVMQAIYKVVAAQNGNVDPDKTMALVRGMKLDSPRGPIEIDPQTREIIQNIYIRRVDKVDGKLQNTEIATFPMVRDPVEK
ncbi:MAG: ABC transporter substrate-binding protein [Candidatus Lustribacter sp.]|jgi:branched-chain amino acid transport system substrate-binding protein